MWLPKSLVIIKKDMTGLQTDWLLANLLVICISEIQDSKLYAGSIYTGIYKKPQKL